MLSRQDLLLRAAIQEASYGESWLQAVRKGVAASHWLRKLEDLSLGVEQVLASPVDNELSAYLISGLVDRHELMSIPITPFTAISFCVQVTGSGSANLAHNQLEGLQSTGPGEGYQHLTTELAEKVYAYFYPPLSPPSTPRNLTAVSIVGGIRFTWEKSGSSGGSLVTGYEVFRNGISQGTFTELEFLDTQVSAGVSYSYSVRAINSVGVSLLAEATPAVKPAIPEAVIVYSSTQSYTTTASDYATKCVTDAIGASVTRAATKTSTVSKDMAISLALAQAKADAIAAISCLISSTPTQTYTSTLSYTTTAADYSAKCGAATAGESVTRTSSKTANTQAEADALALSDAKQQAISAIVCPVPTSTTPTTSYDTNLMDGQVDSKSGTGMTADSGDVLRYNCPTATSSSDLTPGDCNIYLNESQIALLNTFAYLINTPFVYDRNGVRYTGTFALGNVQLSLQ